MEVVAYLVVVVFLHIFLLVIFGDKVTTFLLIIQSFMKKVFNFLGFIGFSIYLCTYDEKIISFIHGVLCHINLFSSTELGRHLGHSSTNCSQIIYAL